MFKLRRWLKKGIDSSRKTNHVIRGLGVKSGDYLDLLLEPAGQACGGPTLGSYGERKLQYTLELSFVVHVVHGFVALILVALLFLGKDLEDSKLCHCHSHSAVSSLLSFSLTSVHHISPPACYLHIYHFMHWYYQKIKSPKPYAKATLGGDCNSSAPYFMGCTNCSKGHQLLPADRGTIIYMG